MTKLTTDSRTIGDAVAALLSLYKAEPEFARELKEVRAAHTPLMQEWLPRAVPQWVKMQETLTRKELSLAKDYFLGAIRTIPDELGEKLAELLPLPDPQTASKLDAYKAALTEMAGRWRLKAFWVGDALTLDQILDMIVDVLPDREYPVEVLEPFLPSTPVPPLHFVVNPYELMYSGRQEIQQKFAKALSDYENKLKSCGWRDREHATIRHARWWFEHYVHGKAYPEIEKEEDGLAYEQTIRKSVWKFSKLLDIEIGRKRSNFTMP